MVKNMGLTGTINAFELYTLREVQKRLGLTESALRSLRNAGLPIIRFGKRGFASGRQVIEFLEGIDSDSQSQSG